MDQQQYSPNYPSGTPEKKNSWQAISALVLGILSIITSCGGIGLIFGILAIVFSLMDKKNNGEGNKLASAGQITGIIGTSLTAIAIIIFFFVVISSGLAISDFVSNYNSSDYDNDYDWDSDYDLEDDWLYITEVPSTEDRTEDTTTEGSDTDYTSTLDMFTDGAFMIEEDTNSYTPEYELKRVGNSDIGYSYVPNLFVNFQEIGGLGFEYSEQYSSLQYDIVGISSDDTTHAQALAQSLSYYIAAEAYGGADPDTAVYSKETFGGYEGYAIKVYYPDEDMWVYMFMFDDENDRGHFMSVEFHADGQYADLWKTVFYNFSMTE